MVDVLFLNGNQASPDQDGDKGFFGRGACATLRRIPSKVLVPALVLAESIPGDTHLSFIASPRLAMTIPEPLSLHPQESPTWIVYDFADHLQDTL